jgi:hypothetical protein
MIASIFFNFQLFRFIYSRLLGIQLFYARFSNNLILKSLKYLNFIYFLIVGGLLIALASWSIYIQHLVKTSFFYSSVEIIIIESLIFIMCILDDRKNSE